MDPTLKEIIELLFRWIHLIAGIMWVGNSMLFNWLDRNLTPKAGASPLSNGEIWLLHSGAFYEVEKKQLAPNEMPKMVHWFWIQATTTWVSGFFLLGLVYYMGGGAFLLDPAVKNLSPGMASALGVGVLVFGWAIYDGLWRSPLKKHPQFGAALCFALLIGTVYGLTQVFSGRAAYLHVGALMGTLMAGNVWMHILPSQRQLVAATKAGKETDMALAYRAKLRSIHNNYMTFPVLFIMISNHYPAAYGHSLNWLILTVLMVGGAGVRHFMNIRFTFKSWIPALTATVVVALGLLTFLLRYQPEVPSSNTPPPQNVTFAQVQGIINQRCTSCHAAKTTDPTFPAAPSGVMLDSPEKIKSLAPRILARAVVSKTMPLGNKTGITDEERALLGQWIQAGAVLP